jgi:prophage regulatory protein
MSEANEQTVPVPDLETEPRQMINIEKVLALVPVGRTTLFRMERDGKFPASHYVSANRRFWYADEVAAWQRALPTNGRIGRRARRVSAGTSA